MGDLFKQIIVTISVGILKMVDFIFALFKIAAGVEQVKIGESGVKVNILTGFLTNKKFLGIFFSIVLLALSVGLIFVIVSTFKNMMKTKKETTKIAGQYLMAVIGMVVVFIAIYGVIILSGEILIALNRAFSSTNSTSIGNSVIETLGKSSARISEDYSKYFLNDSAGNLGGIYNQNFVDDFLGRLKHKNFFNYKFAAGGLINPSSFQSIILLITSCMIGFTTIVSLVQLIIRIFDVITLLLTMPLPLAAYPLDDGAKFGEWRKTIIGKIFLAFGIIMAVNVYLLIISLINDIKFGSSLSLSATGINQAFLLDLFKVFMVVAGSFTLSTGQMLFARIMGVSSEEAHQSGMNFRNAMGGLAAAGGIAKGAAKVLAGGKSKEDKMGEAIARHMGGGVGGSKPSDKGGRFKGISSEKMGRAFQKGGLAGVGASIAVKTGQKLFGKGSGTKIAQGAKNKIGNMKGVQKLKSAKDRISKEGIIGASVKNGKKVMKSIGGILGAGSAACSTQGWED